jgi:transposase-like protein
MAYQAGATVAELAERHGINRRTVSAVVNRGGGSLRYRLIGPTELSLATEMYESGRSLASIGGHLGVSPNTVRLALDSTGVQTRDSYAWMRVES